MAACESSGHDADFVDFMSAAQPDLLRMARFLTVSEDVACEPTTAAGASYRPSAMTDAGCGWPSSRSAGSGPCWGRSIAA
jgi:hypothetical protein